MMQNIVQNTTAVTNSQTINGFRADLNFLRALAVLSVVLFHFQIDVFSGGFIGVDVFFVISGFLMTKIIVTGINAQQFDVIRFYLARAKRIIPALLVLCTVLLVLAWFFLLPSEYRLLAKHAASSAVFLSNYIYLGEAGYFDPSSHEKWLLHTWSLSVEWQFYILYPIALLLINRLVGAKWLRVGVALLALLSLGYMIFLCYSGSKSLYFGLAGRAWEMMAGGIVFLFPVLFNRLVKSFLFYGGVVLIVLSAIYFDNTMLWPSLWALMPIMGTMMVIYSQENASKLVTNPVTNFVGITSYSIYLWHWPVVAAISVFSFGYSTVSIFLGIVLSVLLAYLSYRFVETSARKINGSIVKQLVLVSGATAAVFSLAVVVFLKNGFAIESRFSKAVIAADQEYLNRDPKKSQCLVDNAVKSPHCIYGDNTKKVVAILFGDSHASATVSALATAVADHGSVLFIAQPGCMSVLSMHRIGKVNGTCSEFVENEVEYIMSTYPNIPVVMINRWSYYLKGRVGSDSPLIYFEQPASDSSVIAKQFETKLSETLCQIRKTNPLFLVKPIPEFEQQLPKKVARQLHRGQSGNVAISMTDYQQRNNTAISAIESSSATCGTILLDPTDYLCTDGQCAGSMNNMPLYYDDNHLSESGNLMLVPMFKSILSK